MDRIPLTPPIIKSVSANVARPLWSVMIPTYNCSIHLVKALESVLAQDPGEQVMQIEVIDDDSTDADVEQLVKEIGKGRVSYFRQPFNVGSLRNFETCLNHARGLYVHLLHGDDRVKDGFYRRMTELFEKFPEAGAAICRYNFINSDDSFFTTSDEEIKSPGILNDWLFSLAERPRLQYVSIVVKRYVYEQLGSFYLTTYGEDWEMWARIAKQFPVAYTPEILAEYRMHQGNITGNSILSGQNCRDAAKVIDRITSYLPQKYQRHYSKKARKYYAYYSLRMALALWYNTQNKKAVENQLKEALNLYRCLGTVSKAKLIRLLMLLPIQWFVRLKYINRGLYTLKSKTRFYSSKQ